MENYKQKYEEALERARNYHKGHTLNVNPKTVIEYVFPELKESEDGRMIKSFKRLINAYYDVNFPTPEGFERKDMIAWLEKQGKESIITNVLTNAGLKPYKDGNKWCILAGDNIQDGICGFGDTVDEALFEFLKELIEILNIKPKFKVGDWVVNNETGTIYQVKEIVKLNCGYAYNLTDGGYISSFKSDDYRLWTIKDAKDPRYKENLEVKDVNLNEHQIADIIQNLFPIDNFIESETLLLNKKEAIIFAKHFFKLGLKAQKKE